MIKFDVLNRFTGNVSFTAEIDCGENEHKSVKLGLAVKWALNNDADLRNADLRGADLSDADLRNADLRGADLSDADLRNADLRGADLSDADLRNADLRGADLSDADLRGAYLRDADLCGADLCGANLRGSYLRGADLCGADLCGADLCGADLRGADLSDADLRYAVGNNNELKTIQSGKYVITYSATTMAIGCQQHTIKKWFRFTKRQISEMDSGALEWCTTWKPILKKIIEDNK